MLPRTAAHALAVAVAAATAIPASGCAPTLRTNLSTAATEQVPVTESGLVALPTGETLELAPLLARESNAGRQIQIVRLYGSYFLVGEGFEHLWMVTPKNETKASYEAVDLKALGAEGVLQQPALAPHLESACVRFTWADMQGAHQAFVNVDADAHAENCPK